MVTGERVDEHVEVVVGGLAPVVDRLVASGRRDEVNAGWAELYGTKDEMVVPYTPMPQGARACGLPASQRMSHSISPCSMGT